MFRTGFPECHIFMTNFGNDIDPRAKSWFNFLSIHPEVKRVQEVRNQSKSKV